MNYKISSPFGRDKTEDLKAGDRVMLSGTIYTARDQAHRLMVEALAKGEDLPFDLKDSAIYYVGPSPSSPGRCIGSCGPTTSYRMDPYTETLLDHGLTVMIGKGPRSEEVRKSMIANGAVYLAAVGGCGALMSKSVVSSELIAYEHLGTEAVRKLTVKDMPLIVAIDSRGKDLYSL